MHIMMERMIKIIIKIVKIISRIRVLKVIEMRMQSMKRISEEWVIAVMMQLQRW